MRAPGAGGVGVFLAEHRGRLFGDELFADLSGRVGGAGRGRPSVPADVVASAFVLKELEGLSDRQAAAALSRDIAWKAACGLALDSTVLHDSVATQDTVTQLVAAMRKVRRLVREAREVAVSAIDYDTGAKPDCAWDDEVARAALVADEARGHRLSASQRAG